MRGIPGDSQNSLFGNQRQKAYARVQQAAMKSRDTLVAELATELHVRSVTLYGHVGSRGDH